MRVLITLFLIVLITNNNMFAVQSWYNYTPPKQGYGLYVIESHNNMLFACGADGTILRSDDMFKSYIRLKLPENISNEKFISICSFSNNLFAATESGHLIFSSDDGDIWKEIDLKNTNKINDMNSNDSYLIISSNNGKCIIMEQSLSPKYSKVPDIDNREILAVEVLESGSLIAAGIGAFIAKSTDLGETWKTVKKPGDDYELVTELQEINNTIFGSTSHGWIIYSNDQGDNWSIKNSGQEPKEGLSPALIQTFHVNEDLDFIAFGTFSEQYYSTDSGENWLQQKIDGVFTSYFTDIIEFQNSYFIVGETNFNSSIIQSCSDITSHWNTLVFDDNSTYDKSQIYTKTLNTLKYFSMHNKLYSLKQSYDKSYSHIQNIHTKSIVAECDSNVISIYPFEESVFVTYNTGIFRKYDSNFKNYIELMPLDTISNLNEISSISKLKDVEEGFLIVMRVYNPEQETDNSDLYLITNDKVNKTPDYFREGEITLFESISRDDGHLHLTTYIWNSENKYTYRMFTTYKNNFTFENIDTNVINPEIYEIADVFHKNTTVFSYVLKNKLDSTYLIKDYNEETKQWTLAFSGITSFKDIQYSPKFTYINDTLLIAQARKNGTVFFESTDMGETWSENNPKLFNDFPYLINDITLHKDTLFAACYDNRILYSPLSKGTSVEDKQEHNYGSLDFTIYPNPSSERINIDFKGNIDLVEIYDLSGKMVLSSKSKEIDVSDLKQGTYFLKVNSADKAFYSQFVLTK